MGVTDRLNRFPRLKHAVHHSADRLIRGVAHLGLDINRLRVHVGDDVAGRPDRIALTPIRDVELVPVNGPAAVFDLDPGGFSDLCSRTARGYSLPATGLLEIRGGRFHLPSGIVCVDHRLPAELIPLLRFPHAFQVMPTVRCLTSEPTPVPDGVLINLQMSNSYYHWICEILPRALSAVKITGGGERLFIGRDLPRFAFESLRLLGLEEKCLILPSGVYRAERVSAPTFERAEWPAPEDLRTVRASLLERIGASSTAGRRLLISRGDAVERRILNEGELIAALVASGFERVVPGELSLEEQVRIFSEAEVVVGPHGAGLTNILFAPPGCKVIELAVESHYSPSYVIMASILKQRYGYVRCRELRRHLQVDAAAVSAVLEQLERTV